MILEINDLVTVSELQEKFAAHYPYLKLELYKPSPITNGEVSVIDPVRSYKELGSFKKIWQPGSLEIMPWFTVQRLEDEFKSKFGLDVRIFKKVAGTWQLSSADCFCTIKQQSDSALQQAPLSRPVTKKKQVLEYDCL
jgi:hypothetical protein